jgi:hypothetical protein
MMSITDAAVAFAANPLPVLYLDTCAFLDVARAPARAGGPEAVRAAEVLLANSAPSTLRVHLVTCEVVRAEWKLNLEATKPEVKQALETYHTVNAVISLTGLLSGLIPGPLPPVAILTAQVTGHFDRLSRDLLDRATCVTRDLGCLERALDRQISDPQRLPARGKTGAKDCVILEHVLELSRSLGQSYQKPRYFVSSNAGDFAGPSVRHDLSSAGLEFVPSLHHTVARLRAGGHL